VLNAAVTAIASHLPAAVLDNAELAEATGWAAEKIWEKTGIRERRVAAADETAGDLAAEAGRKLLAQTGVDPGSIDMLLFCTETPDYLLPATACLLHGRLGLRPGCGALDYNLGCSGYVYGLALAQGLVASGAARRVLLLTADTYSKLINPRDRSVRTLFGDAATATLVEVGEATGAIGPFVFGTDGTGAERLIVRTGGARQPRTVETGIEQEDAHGNLRSADQLYMDGPEIMAFTLKAVPEAVRQLLERAALSLDSFDHVVLHQANGFLLERLRRKLAVAPERFVVALERVGNTVSSSLPLALEPLLSGGGGARRRALLVGFGVGYSWAAASVMI
jgi:3-oxoacyl-[acyl-carrier-protein] synthase III